MKRSDTNLSTRTLQCRQSDVDPLSAGDSQTVTDAIMGYGAGRSFQSPRCKWCSQQVMQWFHSMSGGEEEKRITLVVHKSGAVVNTPLRHRLPMALHCSAR